MQGVNNLATSSVDLDGDSTDDILTRYGYPDSTRTTGITQAMGTGFESQWAWSSDGSRSRFSSLLRQYQLAAYLAIILTTQELRLLTAISLILDRRIPGQTLALSRRLRAVRFFLCLGCDALEAA
jgi:hypothetical protein